MVDGKIYAASDGGGCLCVGRRRRRFKLLAQSSLGEMIRATPAVANGALYIRTKDHLYCIEWQNDASEPLAASAAE